MSTAFTLIWDLARQTPRGTVVTYGQLAKLAGNPRWARVAGYAMHAAPADVPWQRVVNRRGEVISPAQRVLLEGEGVCFLPNGRVDMGRFSWLG